MSTMRNGMLRIQPVMLSLSSSPQIHIRKVKVTKVRKGSYTECLKRHSLLLYIYSLYHELAFKELSIFAKEGKKEGRVIKYNKMQFELID